MGKAIMGAVVSLDGFIADDRDVGVGRKLHGCPYLSLVLLSDLTGRTHRYHRSWHRPCHGTLPTYCLLLLRLLLLDGAGGQ